MTVVGSLGEFEREFGPRPAFTVDRYGGTYSITPGPERLRSLAKRLLGWAVLWPFIPEPRPRRWLPVPRMRIAGPRPSVDLMQVQGSLGQVVGAIDFEGFYVDDALRWARRYERDLRHAAMRRAAQTGTLAPGLR